MHPRNIAAHNAAARETIRAAAAGLADELGLEPLATITEGERRDRDVAQMRELECIAALIDQAATALKERSHANQG